MPAEQEAVRTRRSDAKRNHDALLAAAREAFADTGASTSLEAVARRAGVGIGTLYRHFPNRQALLEAVYVEEVRSLCARTGELMELPPRESFETMAQRVASYLATKHALADEMLTYVGQDAPFFKDCRRDLFEATRPILERAQQAHVVRADTNIVEVVKLIGGIARMGGLDAAQREHMLLVALAGFRAPE